MAGDWIKMRVGLITNPRVMRLAECLLEDGKFLDWSGLSYGVQGYPPPTEDESRGERHAALRVTRYVTVTALLRFWGYANEHAKGEFIAGIFPEDVEEITGVPGFSAAIEAAGWVRFEAGGGMTMPNFSEHNTSAGERSSAAERQKRYREKAKRIADSGSEKSDVTRDVTVTPREEKRREEKKEQEPKGSSASASAEALETASNAIPYQAIVDAYNTTMTNLPRVRELTPKRRTLIRSAWQASRQRQGMEFWGAYFAECQDDPFLNGAGPYRPPHDNWRPSFDYLLKADVVTKVFEAAMDRMERES